MAKPTTFPFGEFFIVVGDGDSPEVFAAPCGLTSKAFNQTSNTQDTTVPDCDDPDAPAFIERAVDSQTAEISGSGVLAKEAFDAVWQPWFASAMPKNCRIGLGAIPDVSTGAYYEGAFILSQFNMTASRGQKVNVEVTMVSDGEWTYVEAVT